MMDDRARPSVDDIEVKLLLEAIFLRYHYDFRAYSMGVIRRRLAQALPVLGCDSLAALQARVLRDPALFGRLRDELTVQVSEMFRDPTYFRALREQVIPLLATYPSIKVWVAGCSTGEEVYSLAILLEEEGLLERTVLYGTDINVVALEAAGRGIYSLDSMAQFSRNHQQAGGKRSLSDYYTTGYGGAVFDRRLRRRLVLSDHDLATDTVFAEVQLISCRNVLIYFDRDLQDRALGLFRDALCRRGFLGLGKNESLLVSAHVGAFSEYAREHKIYQRAECSR